MKRDFCKFIVAVTIVLVGVAAIDICTGKAMESLLPKVDKLCETGRLYYSLNEVEAPILVIGSSRAHHHYVPKILTDGLGLEAYNLGSNGCFFSYNCCVINSILDRYTPEIVIWENTNTSLLENEIDPLEHLYPYYLSNRNVHTCINSYYDSFERIPLWSNLYRYNSKIHRILIRSIVGGEFENGLNGYLPLPPRHWLPNEKDALFDVEGDKNSLIKTRVFAEILTRLKNKGVYTIIVNSPYYSVSEKSKVNESSIRMKEICDSLGVKYIDNSQLDGIYGNIDMFYDNVHLNEKGAEHYSTCFVNQIGHFINGLY